MLGARLDAADAALAELDFAAALAHAEAAIADDRLSERAQRARMLALYALGRQHEALEGYRRVRGVLDDELGLEPTAETRALEAAILRQHDVRTLVPRPIQPPPAAGVSRRVRLLDRAKELQKLESAVREALEGTGGLLLIEGEAGVGKTRLLDELAVGLVGVRLGRTSCAELERHLPYVPLAAALRDALAGVEVDAGRRPALRCVLPELESGTARMEHADVEVLEALVAVIGEQSPMVLLIDDLHWADEATFAALSYLHRRVGVAPALVATVCSDQAPHEHPVRGLRPDAVVRLAPVASAERAPPEVPELADFTGGNLRS